VRIWHLQIVAIVVLARYLMEFETFWDLYVGTMLMHFAFELISSLFQLLA